MKANLAFLLLFPVLLQAQTGDCVFGPPSFTIHFGSGNVQDLNKDPLSGYGRVTTDCPRDGYYAYTPFTNDCFRSDWLTLAEDHTPGDTRGNMMLVNASWRGASFLTTAVKGLKGGTVYQFGVWLMNVCKPSKKCPFPLLPNLTISLLTPDGKSVARISTGELERRATPLWIHHRAVFTMPSAATPLIMTIADEVPSGCGNDFALDDITFRECVKKPPPVTTPKPPAVKKSPAAKGPVAKKNSPALRSLRPKTVPAVKPQVNSPVPRAVVVKQRTPVLPSPPPVLALRANPVVKRIETEAGEIRLDLYDNGEIDGDTVSIYHNNALVVSRAVLGRKPVSLRIAVDAARPHHELVLVAENLGSIPPNTSLMTVTTATGRYEVFISSSEQKNAKLVIDLKR